MEIDNFIGIFPNAFSKIYCEGLIKHFNLMLERDKVWTRQESDNAPKNLKDTRSYFFTEETDSIVVESTSQALRQFSAVTHQCYKKYTEKYGAVCDLGKHSLSYGVKMQRTLPSEGYHIWHCETQNRDSSARFLAVQLYLNDVEEGGETEFLYQSKRVKPKQGTLLIWPSMFTHTHRGNPPLAGVKYTLNGWIDFKD